MSWFYKARTCAYQSLAILFKMEGCVVYCKAPDAKQMSALMTVYYSLSVPFRKVFICKGQVSNSCNRHCRWQFKMRHFKRQANQSCYYIPLCCISDELDIPGNIVSTVGDDGNGGVYVAEKVLE